MPLLITNENVTLRLIFHTKYMEIYMNLLFIVGDCFVRELQSNVQDT